MTASEPELFPAELPPRLRLERIAITGIKAIDHLELQFPPPDLPGDPDVFVLGSRNGVGKTSLLESCALFLSATSERNANAAKSPLNNGGLTFGPPGLKGRLGALVRSGATFGRITGRLSVAQASGEATVDLLRSGHVGFTGDTPIGVPVSARHASRQNGLVQLESLAAGAAPDPLITPFVLYFHSYRRVLEGSESLGSLAEGSRRRGAETPRVAPIAVFKQELLRALMGRAALFEQIPDDSAPAVLATLNSLMGRYAQGTIDKLLPQPDDTFDFRVQPLAGRPTYSFDSLSSGQKEVISTLFLIWLFTRDQPAVVLIDEPELHLNPEWHRTFVRDLAGIAPNNQYILATHSEDIFASVDPAHRALLEPDGGAQ